MTIYLLTSPDGEHIPYTQIGAFLKCQLNPIFVTPQHWSELAKEGYPVTYKGWTVEKEEKEGILTYLVEIDGKKLLARTGKIVEKENNNFL